MTTSIPSLPPDPWHVSGVRVVRGDLLAMAHQGSFDIIWHGCNTQKTMGAGIAKQIAQHFPEAYKADQTFRPDLPLHERMGMISHATVTVAGSPLVIINGYTQRYPGRPRPPHDDVDHRLAAIASCLHRIGRHAGSRRIGMPAVGCGLAGLPWLRVAPLIASAADHMDITVVILPHEPPPGSSDRRS